MSSKPSHTGWIATLLVLLLPILGLAGWEALQRHRFSVQAERLEAALRAFQSTATMIGEDGRPLPTASGRTSQPYFALISVNEDKWDYRLHRLHLGAVFVDWESHWHPVWVEVEIQQKRTVLLGSPQIVVVCKGLDAALEAAFFNAIKNFTYISAVTQ